MRSAMKLPRRRFLHLAAGAAVASLAVTATEASGGKIRVGFINPTGSPEFWQRVSSTMRAAAVELGIDIDTRYTQRSYDKAIALARDFLSERPPLDYLIATNDLGAGGAIIKLADAANVPIMLLDNDLDQKEWAEYEASHARSIDIGSAASCPTTKAAAMGLPRQSSRRRCVSRNDPPLRLLALAGDVGKTPASNDRVRGLKRAVDVMSKLLGSGSVQLVDNPYRAFISGQKHYLFGRAIVPALQIKWTAQT